MYVQVAVTVVVIHRLARNASCEGASGAKEVPTSMAQNGRKERASYSLSLSLSVTTYKRVREQSSRHS